MVMSSNGALVYDRIMEKGRPVNDREWITVAEAAAILSVHPQTVRLWLRSGQLPGTLLSRKAGYRIKRADVEHILTNGLPPDDATKRLGTES
jgi:excisionase family DNA binding protein